jgi:8-amino-7-oxononanoate synthase
MNYYESQIQAIQKAGRFRTRTLYDKDLLDLASNDYLGLATKKKLFKQAVKVVNSLEYYGPKSSQLVNGYSPIHSRFEKRLAHVNGFEEGIVVGSGFLANISLIEGLVRKKDILFIDEEYHASGMLACKLVENVVIFKHNNIYDLEEKIKAHQSKGRVIIAIEGVYSMGGDIAPKSFAKIAKLYNALLIVDEAHSSGVIGKNLLGWFDYHNLEIENNYIKMGTLGKAYGSYGAYILASSHIVEFLQNRAKAVIYTTAPSLFDMAHGLVNFEYIQKKKEKLKKKIKKRKNLIEHYLELQTNSLILPIEIGNNKKVIEIQEELKNNGFMVGAIRQPTVSKAILRVILKLDISLEDLKRLTTLLSNHVDCV